MTESRSIKVLLINVHSAQNAGDAALTCEAIRQLEENLPGCVITLAANDPKSFDLSNPMVPAFSTIYSRPRHQWIRMLWIGVTGGLACLIYRLIRRRCLILLPYNARALFTAYFEADLVVGTPGGYLYSTRGKALPFLSVIFPFIFAVLAGKPLYCMPQSYGPYRFGWEKRLAGWLLSRARLVMSREPESLRTLNEIGLDCSRRKDMVDIGFAFIGASPEEARNWMTTHYNGPGPHLGITVLNWDRQSQAFHTQERFEAAIAAVVRNFVVEYGGHVWFFPQCSGPTADEDDRLVARRIGSQINDLSQHVTVIEEPMSPALLQAVYGQMDLFIGTRMHSNIFALTTGVPVLAIGYLYKTRGMMAALGLSKWMVDIHRVDPNSLSNQLNLLWQNRRDVRAEITSAMPLVIEHAQSAGRMIAADYSQLRSGK